MYKSGIVNGNNYCINFSGSLTCTKAASYHVSSWSAAKLRCIPVSSVHLTNKQSMTGNIWSFLRHVSLKDSDLFPPENPHLLRISLTQIILLRSFQLVAGGKRFLRFPTSSLRMRLTWKTFQLETGMFRFILGSAQSRYKKMVGLALCILILPELILYTLHRGIQKLPTGAAAPMHCVSYRCVIPSMHRGDGCKQLGPIHYLHLS